MSAGNSVMRGCSFYPSGNSPRTIDRSRPPESETVKPKSQTELLADMYLAAHERHEAEARAEEQRKADAEQAARLQRQQDAFRAQREAEQLRKEQELNERRAALSNAEFQIDGIFYQYGLSPLEQSSVEDALTERQLWTNPMAAVEYATVEAMRIVAERK
jgi:hypothetical protein